MPQEASDVDHLGRTQQRKSGTNLHLPLPGCHAGISAAVRLPSTSYYNPGSEQLEAEAGGGGENQDRAVPERFARRESLQVATKVVECQVRRAQAPILAQDSSIEEPLSRAVTSVPDRSASPVLFDDADEMASPGAEGVLGVLFDMYRLQVNGSIAAANGNSSRSVQQMDDMRQYRPPWFYLLAPAPYVFKVGSC